MQQYNIAVKFVNMNTGNVINLQFYCNFIQNQKWDVFAF